VRRRLELLAVTKVPFEPNENKPRCRIERRKEPPWPPICPLGSSHISGKPLTNSKHEHFAHLVTKGESPARAYVLCGYSEHGALQSGNRLLRKPDVAARAEEARQRFAAKVVDSPREAG
jgi:hypothetical protein